MANVIFFSFQRNDKEQVARIKGRAENSNYSNLNFWVHDLLVPWDTDDESKIREAISKEIKGTSRTIVFVGNKTHKSKWVQEEVKMTLERDKPVYAIRLKGKDLALKPSILEDNNIKLNSWSESTLQRLATK